jgi:peptidoglycan/LPS O-acetylase OafA/YrhL
MSIRATAVADRTVAAPETGAQPSVPTRNLDIIRALAVAFVFFAHLILTLNGGQNQQGPVNLNSLGRVGVLIFFVHTALVLMLSMERMRETGGLLCARFYVRRLFRIYPLSIAVCIAVSLAQIPSDVLGTPFVWNWEIFTANIFLAQRILELPNLSAPLWSLPLEVEMYLFLPLIFLFLKGKRRTGRMLGLWLGSIVLSRFGFHSWTLELLLYIPCFMVGVLVYGYLPSRKPLFPWWGLVLGVAALGSVFAVVRLTTMGSILFCALIGMLILMAAECEQKSVWLPAHLIARYSYGIYLCHFPLMWVFYRHLADWPTWTQHLGFFAAMIALPILTYHWIEAPMVKLGVFLSGKIGSRV